MILVAPTLPAFTVLRLRKQEFVTGQAAAAVGAPGILYCTVLANASFILWLGMPEALPLLAWASCRGIS